MNILNKYIPLLTVAAVLTLSSCISDDSTEGGNELPTLTIANSNAETMPVYNFYMGDDAVINPEVNYSGNDSLTYHWQVGTYVNGNKGTLEDAGYGKQLRHHFYSGGSYYAHLTVTDGRVGTVADYQINMNRTFEEGYLISATDADGSGNLTFVKVLTPEEVAAGTGDVIIEHALEKTNEGVTERGLVGALTGSYYSRERGGDITRLIISTQDSVYFVEPNELTIVSANSYNNIYPGFKASGFYKGMSGIAPYVYDKNLKKFEHIQVANQFPFEYQYYDNFQPEDILQGKSNYWGSEYISDYYIDYTDSRVMQFNSYSFYGMGDLFASTGDALKGQTIITAFPGFAPNSSYAIPSYILTSDNDNVTLWTCNVSAYQWTANSFTPKQIRKTADLAIPAQGTKMVPSLTYSRMYYAIGNKVYVLLPDNNTFALPTVNQYAIAFPDDEEVTFMDTNSSTNELYVATYNSSTRRGSLYIYNCVDVRTDNASSVKAKKSWKDITGRINNLIYKPSIQ